jgi:hypothetical protein
VVFSVLPGTDGGLLFGGGDEDAAAVDITFPDDAGAPTTPVADSGFFGIAIPDAAMRTMMIATQPGPKDPPTKDGGPIMGFVPERVAAISVAASDAKGHQNRLRCPRDAARGRNGNRARSQSHPVKVTVLRLAWRDVDLDQRVVLTP